MAEFDVFLSHNSKDKPVVRELAEALHARGLKVWLDETHLIPGRRWQKALQEAIKSSKTVAVLLGNEMGAWEEPEMEAAIGQFIKRQSPVIPVLLPNAPEQPELPMFLEGFTWVDFRGNGIDEATLDRLEWGITGRPPRRESKAAAINEQDSDQFQTEQFAELTKYARHRMVEVASQWLAQECDPFVMPALSRRTTRPEVMAERDDSDPWEEVSEDDTRALLLGNLPDNHNRVRIFSQSGTGKTTLLHYCEKQIAGADDGRVPVRVSALSTYNWTNEHEVPLRLANRVLHSFMPTDTDEGTRVEWLRRLVREHRIVFLCDAVDQTDDQLAGFGQFLECADVCDCPVIVTGRPEVEQTRASVFRETDWQTYRVEPLDERRIREYLSELSDRLLPMKEESWRDRESYERKQHWSDLLQVPLLLRLMRRLASVDNNDGSASSLADLHNRHAIYRKAVRHLVDQGWTSLHDTEHREDLLDYAEVNEHLSEMAWTMVAGDNFTSIFGGRPFQQWRKQHRTVVRALEQVDLTTRYSLLDSPGEYGLAWRHLSFCEYFAGVHLAEQDREQQEAVVRKHGRTPSWQWVFRFALSELEAEGNQDDCAALARDLIRFGSPFLVYDAIRGDGLKLPDQLDTLCRWLVHREWSSQGGDYSNAWSEDTSPPDLDDDTLSILATLFDRSFRDSRYLHPAWELLEGSTELQAVAIREGFLAELNDLAAGSQETSGVGHSFSLDEHFLPCPPKNKRRRTFKIGEKSDQSTKVDRFYLGKAPITNEQFELFDPSHRQWRDQYSPDDDSPALYVNWYMAVMFCTWLGEGHRLPTEDEWEVACRAGTTTEYWWGDDFDKAKCNAEGNVGRATPADPAHANDWGFMEMCGNVWEWCEGRVLRGGAWVGRADDCRCSSRLDFFPYLRFNFVGFRLARTYR